MTTLVRVSGFSNQGLRSSHLEISHESAEVLLDQSRGPGQVRSVLMEIDGVSHGTPLMSHELGAVLGSDDAYRVSGETVTQRLDLDLW